MTVSPRIAAVSTFSTAGLLFGAALLPAGSAFAADGCGSDATLVADGICEVTFTETPDSAWTPPAGITKLQALIVGGGGAAGEAASDAYAGGAGDVRLIELNTTGDVDITVGAGGNDVAGDGEDTEIIQGALDEFAIGGQVGAPGGALHGGESGNGYTAEDYDGGGAGAGGGTSNEDGGIGVVVNEIDPSVFTLFANDDRCLGGGGAAAYTYTDGGNGVLYDGAATCGGGYPVAGAGATLSGNQWTWAGTREDVELSVAEANTGGGGGGIDRDIRILGDGADGVVTLRYDAELAATGFDATGSIVAGSALVAGGAVIATRRRRNA